MLIFKLKLKIELKFIYFLIKQGECNFIQKETLYYQYILKAKKFLIILILKAYFITISLNLVVR